MDLRETISRMTLNQLAFFLRLWESETRMGFARNQDESRYAQELARLDFIRRAARLGKKQRWICNIDLIRDTEIKYIRSLLIPTNNEAGSRKMPISGS